MDPKIEEMAKDPVMGRAFRELGRPLAEVATGPAPPTTGNDYNGPPTSGVRARDITQDRPSDLVPSYSLPGRATDPPLAWHRQACDLAAGQTGNGTQGNEATVRSAAEPPIPAAGRIHPAVAHMHPELGRHFTAMYDLAVPGPITAPNGPQPSPSPPVQAAPAVKPTGLDAVVATPEFAKIKAAIAEVYKEAREAGNDRPAGQDNRLQQSRGREGHGR